MGFFPLLDKCETDLRGENPVLGEWVGAGGR